MKIEVATEEDIGQLNQLVNTCYRGEESRIGWTSEVDIMEGARTSPESLREVMTSPNITIFKGTDEEDSGRMIACVLGDRQGERLHVGMLCVQPGIQGKGIGKQMMSVVEGLGRELNCKKLKIEVIPTRTALVGWYERQGFRRTGKVLPFPEPGFGVGAPKIPLEIIEMERVIVNES